MKMKVFLVKKNVLAELMTSRPTYVYILTIIRRTEVGQLQKIRKTLVNMSKLTTISLIQVLNLRFPFYILGFF